MFRNDSKEDLVTQGERWYFLLDPESYRATFLIKVDDCGEGSHAAQLYMDECKIKWRRFGEKTADKKQLKVWLPLHHSSTKYTVRSQELMNDVDRGSARALPETLFAVVITSETKEVDLTYRAKYETKLK